MPGAGSDSETGVIGPVRFAEPFNAAAALIDRHLAEGRGGKPALLTLEDEVSYAQLAAQVNRHGNALLALGIGRGERLLMVLKDCPEFVYLFWGAIKAGVIPVPLNTLLRVQDYAFIIGDSGCSAIACSPEFAPTLEEACRASTPRPQLLRLAEGPEGLAAWTERASAELRAVPSRAADDCFLLYSSGTTGLPKGVVHAQGSIEVTCRRFAVQTLGASERDVFFSVPRLYFSYGLGCAMNFPLWVGGTGVLDSRRPTPQTVAEVLRRFRPTVLSAVPSFYLALLESAALAKDDVARLRCCLSGGEATPPELQRRWRETTGVPIMEVLGSTEMLHIYIAAPRDGSRPGVTGWAVPGYEARIAGDDGREVKGDAPGRLWVRGQSMLTRYWNSPEKTARAIVNGWLDTGDTFRREPDGAYVYCGRSDDMLKVGGRWVAPFEIESALIEHPAVLEAAVVGRPDESGLTGAAAWVVLRDPSKASAATIDAIRAFCKGRLAPYKAPRWIHFVETLPKTATGKVQRFKLRAISDAAKRN